MSMSGRSPREEYPLQYSYLENSMDRGAWQATVHGVEKSLTLLIVTLSLSAPDYVAPLDSYFHTPHFIRKMMAYCGECGIVVSSEEYFDGANIFLEKHSECILPIRR